MKDGSESKVMQSNGRAIFRETDMGGGPLSRDGERGAEKGEREMLACISI